MVGKQLKQLQEQIKFLVDVEQDSFEECLQEFGSLMVFLEQGAATVQDDSVDGGLELVRKVLSENYHDMRSEYEEELVYLRQQLEIVSQALTVKDDEKLAEIEKLILADVGDLEDNESFKKRVSEANAQTRQEFLGVVAEVREAVSAGSVDELAAFFQAAEMANKEGLNLDDDSEDSESEENDGDLEEDASDLELRGECKNCENMTCEEDVHPFDFTSNEEVMKILKEFSEPYSINLKQENDPKKD